MARRVEDLICWQLADQLRQLIIAHTADGTSAGKDFRFTSNLRDAISEVADEMTALCGRASIANLRYLKSLDRPDPPE
jgi:hypothetical protein